MGANALLLNQTSKKIPKKIVKREVNDCDVESLGEKSDKSNDYGNSTKKPGIRIRGLSNPDGQSTNSLGEALGPSEERKRRKKRIIKKIVKKKASDGTYITELTTTTLKRDGSRSIIREIKRYDSQEC
jgi:hypothetical protein